MKIQVPAEEESSKQKRNKLLNFLGGLVIGFIVFGFIGIRIFKNGFEKVETYTWIALGFGVISFGFLARWFGSEFWSILSRRN